MSNYESKKSYESNASEGSTVPQAETKFGQPAPIPNDKPALWPMVIEDFRNGFMKEPEMSIEGYRNLVSKIVDDMHARDQFGRNKYGTPLQANNGRDSLKDSYEELLDAAVYLKQTIETWDIDAAAKGQFISSYRKLQKQIAIDTYRKTLDSIYAIKKLIEERR
jgi:hypothetical protein